MNKNATQKAEIFPLPYHMKTGQRVVVVKDPRYRADAPAGTIREVLPAAKCYIVRLDSGKMEQYYPDDVMQEDAFRAALKYIQDPNTRVYIYRNNELNGAVWMYSVAVEGSEGFWLNSFYSKPEAEEFILVNHLHRCDVGA